MTFTRVSILGSAGLVLGQLLACSSGSEPAKNSNSQARNERVDSSSVGSDPGAARSNGDPPTTGECDYHEGDAFDPDKIKWRNTLPKPRKFAPTHKAGYDEYRISVRDKKVQMLPDCYPQTQVFAYGGSTLGENESEPKDAWSSPGPTFEMERGTPAHVIWSNEIAIPHFLPVDPTLHWANPNGVEKPTGPFSENSPKIYPNAQENVPIVTHVHGLEVASDSDGAPEAWFTPLGLKTGPAFEDKPSEYPNSQPATTLWYHDHALGITRLNVYAGLAGMYIIRDKNDDIENPKSGVSALPNEAHEMPLVIQDKAFNKDGSLAYPSGPSPEHPLWNSFFYGDTMVVNGKVWPKMEVERTRYRFRILNAANSRSFTLSLPDQRPFTVIGSDGGYLAAPIDTGALTLGPGERADVVIDFSTLEPGEAIVLNNYGEEILQFKALGSEIEPKPATCALTANTPQEPKLPLCFPNGLNTMVELATNTDKRTVTLVPAPDGGHLLDGKMYDDKISELPRVGATEDWDIVNMSSSDHPIHLHLVQFRILNRQLLDTDAYTKAWNAANDGGALPLPNPTQNLKADDYLQLESKAVPPADAEAGWKDTVMASGSSVTRIRVRWAPQDAASNTALGFNAFRFDPSQGPGYVWHCHMLEHEDNEMMRPLKLQK